MPLARHRATVPRLLVVVDEPLMRQKLGDMLREAGWRVDCVASGPEALEAFPRLQPDLVLLDLAMPGMDGCELSRQLRALPGGSHKPLLMLTSLDDEATIDRAFETGITDFIAKPVNRQLLLHRVRSLLRSSAGLNRLRMSEERLAKAQANGRLGFWEWEAENDQLWLSEEACTLLALPVSPFLAPLQHFLDLLPNTEHASLREQLTATLTSGARLDLELRILPPAGEEILAHCRGEALLDSAGSRHGAWGTLQNITEFRSAETRMLLLKQAVDALPVGITITDKGGRIIYVNSVEASMHGYTPEELLDREARLFAPERLRKQAPAPMPLDQIRLWRRESVNRRKNGDEFPVQLSSIAVHNRNGEVLGLVTACEDITERKQAEQRIHQLAFYDHLTGLHNRWMFRDRLHQALAMAERSGREIALFFLDLDRFKLINDTMGHEFGDKLLVAVAERLQSCMRKADTVARLGGDEFVVVLTDVDDFEGAAAAARRIIEDFLLPFELDGKTIYTQPSIGIAIAPHDGRGLDELIRHADTALYHAKTLGGATFSFFTHEMNRNAMEKIVLETELRQALDRQEFSLFYQPQVELASGQTCAVEALLRWHHPEDGLVEPVRFIDVLEDSGLIHRLGAWLLRAAATAARTWKIAGTPLTVAVNISPRQFRQPGFLDMLDQILAETGTDPTLLQIELTEGTIMDEPEKSIALLQKLRERGLRIAIDDFGTGYSSLSYLKNFPIDTIKIDRSFIRDLLRNNEDTGIVEAIVHIARRLSLKVVAEGIENREQAEFLLQCGCDFGQGFFFARPQPQEGLMQLLTAAPEPTPLAPVVIPSPPG